MNEPNIVLSYHCKNSFENMDGYLSLLFVVVSNLFFIEYYFNFLIC